MASTISDSVATPVVSVIVPCYNVVATINDQLDALATQEDAPPFEVVVVDNRSTDGLRELVAKRCSTLGVDVRLVSANDAQGVSHARNIGIRASRADLLMFCDADDVVSRYWVRAGCKSFGTRSIWSGSAITLNDAEFESGVDAVRNHFDDNRTWTPPVSEQAGSPFPVLLGGNFGVTRDLISKLGGFDEAFSRGEDNDLAIRSARLGEAVYVSKSAVVATRRHEASVERIAYLDGMAHALLAARHGLWRESPFGPWSIAVMRAVAAGARMVIVPGRRDWAAWRLRWARTRGFTRGAVAYQLFRRIPSASLRDDLGTKEI